MLTFHGQSETISTGSVLKSGQHVLSQAEKKRNKKKKGGEGVFSLGNEQISESTVQIANRKSSKKVLSLQSNVRRQRDGRCLLLLARRLS